MARAAGGALLKASLLKASLLKASLLKARWAISAFVAVLGHPSLWPTALKQLATLAAPGWWRRPPFLPLPPPDYLRFRMETAYGGAGDQVPPARDLLTYLRWCRDFPA